MSIRYFAERLEKPHFHNRRSVTCVLAELLPIRPERSDYTKSNAFDYVDFSCADCLFNSDDKHSIK
jgi:hypothetical protein